METIKLAGFLDCAEALSDLDSACLSWRNSKKYFKRVASFTRRLAGEVASISVKNFQLAERISDESLILLRYAEEIEDYTLHEPLDRYRNQVFRRELEDLLTSVRYLYEELRGKEILVPENEYLKYQSLRIWSSQKCDYNKIDKYAPRSTIRYLTEAGQCLSYGGYRGAVTLSLQAVEAMLRYYYFRCGGPKNRKTWGAMLKWLGGKESQIDLFPKDSPLHEKLKDLLNVRNSLAHGRNYPGAENDEVIERRLNESLETVVDLIVFQEGLADPSSNQRNRLDLSFQIHRKIDFDIALALYILKWNPELPSFNLNQVIFDSQVDIGCIKDETLQDDLVRTESMCLSELTCEHIRLEPDYRSILDPLIDFSRDKILNCQRYQLGYPQMVDLADLFEGILEKNGEDPIQTLIDSWALFDKYLETPFILPRSDELVNKLDAQEYFQHYLRRRQRQDPSGMSIVGSSG